MSLESGKFPSQILSQILGVCSVAAVAIALTGCSNMVTTAAEESPVFDHGFTGTIMGGRQPIGSASVKLWAAGNSGYGSAGSLLATVTSDASGNFSFQPTPSYTCPSSTSTSASQYLYITASGGYPSTNTSGTGIQNPQAALMLGLGNCATVLAANPKIIINEATTVASMTALQQFFKPDTVNGLGSIGTSSTNLTGLANAMAVIPNMVNIASGQAIASSTASASVSGYTTAPVVTAISEQTKLNTMADILAACVNTGGSNTTTPNACNTLYANSGGSPLDTLQAAYYMATIPAGSGTPAACTTGTTVTTAPSICSLFGLATTTPPYQPNLAAAPTDFTLAVTYGSASTSTAAIPFLTKPEYVAIDAAGDVWVANVGSATATTNNSVTELSPTGAPMNQVLTTAGIVNPSTIAIDPTGNVWVPGYGASGAGTSVYEYTTAAATNTFTTNKGPQRLTVDGQGNVYVIESLYKGLGNIEEIGAGNTSGSAYTLATNLSTDFSNILVDANYTLWVTGGGTGTTATGSSTGYAGLFQYVPASTVGITAGSGSGAAASAVFTGGKLTAINLISGGSGYTYASQPTVAISGNAGTGATATALIGFGVASAILTTGGGGNYTTAPTSVIFTGGGGSGATATLTTAYNNGFYSVTSISVTNGGTGYTSPPAVSFGGGVYSGAFGQPATAQTTLYPTGSITGFTITAAGSGYTLPYAASPNSPIAVSAVTAPESAIAVDNNNNFFVQNYGKETYAQVSGTTVATLTSSAGTSPTLLAAPQFEAIDGAGSLWLTDAASTGSVFALTSADTPISPSVGFAHSYYYPYGIAIDPSGNVWIGSENTPTFTFQLTEIIGAAAPVGTPLAADLPNTQIPGSTSKLGIRP